MRNLGIFWKNISKRVVKFAAILFVFIFCFAAFCGVYGCGGAADGSDDYEIGGDYRNVSIFNTDAYKVSNLTTDSNGQKTFGVVCGDLWQEYVSGGTGYVIYQVKPERGKTFASLELSFEAFYSICYRSGSSMKIYPYDMADKDGNWKTNIIVEISWDGTNFTEIYNLHDEVGDELSESVNEYVGENAKKVDLMMSYSTKEDLYVKVKCVHMTYKDFDASERITYQSIFGKMVNGYGQDGGIGIELHRLGIRLYSCFIRGTYAA